MKFDFKPAKPVWKRGRIDRTRIYAYNVFAPGREDALGLVYKDETKGSRQWWLADAPKLYYRTRNEAAMALAKSIPEMRKHLELRQKAAITDLLNLHTELRS